MENPSQGGSVLTKEAMDAVWELDAKVLALEVRQRPIHARNAKAFAADRAEVTRDSGGVSHFLGYIVLTETHHLSNIIFIAGSTPIGASCVSCDSLHSLTTSAIKY